MNPAFVALSGNESELDIERLSLFDSALVRLTYDWYCLGGVERDSFLDGWLEVRVHLVDAVHLWSPHLFPGIDIILPAPYICHPAGLFEHGLGSIDFAFALLECILRSLALCDVARYDLCIPLVTYSKTVSYTHLRAHETRHDLVCRLLLEKKKKKKKKTQNT